MHLILFLIYILLILMVIFVERKRPTEALLWVVIMICLPYFGTVLYLIFRHLCHQADLCGSKKKLSSGPYRKDVSWAVSADEKNLSDLDLQVARFNRVYNGSLLTCSQLCGFFYTDGERHYGRLFRDLRDAEECIFYRVLYDTSRCDWKTPGKSADGKSEKRVWRFG